MGLKHFSLKSFDLKLIIGHVSVWTWHTNCIYPCVIPSRVCEKELKSLNKLFIYTKQQRWISNHIWFCCIKQCTTLWCKAVQCVKQHCGTVCHFCVLCVTISPAVCSLCYGIMLKDTACGTGWHCAGRGRRRKSDSDIRSWTQLEWGPYWFVLVHAYHITNVQCCHYEFVIHIPNI